MDYPGEKLLLRLWETVAEKGIGALLSPWQIRREGRARVDVRREELLALAQAERDVEDIRSGLKSVDADGQLVGLLEPTSLLPMQDRLAPQNASAIVGRNLIAEAIRAEVNVGKALLAAEAELEPDPQTPPQSRVDDDWLFRWRDSAGAVSSEELQNLWGRVLAGEIKSPGSFSLRALEFLKNLSREEALQIAKLSRFVVASAIFRGNTPLLESEGMTFAFLLGMQQLGIIAGVEAVGGLNLTMKSTETAKFMRALVSHDRVLIATHEDASKEIKLDVYQLTSLGQQILKLGSFESHEVYLRSVGQALRGQGFKVLIGRYEQVTETEGRYFDAQELDV